MAQPTIEAARVAFGKGGDLRRLMAWLSKKAANYRLIADNGFTTVEVLLRSPEKLENIQKLCNLQRKNYGFSRERSRGSFLPMTREEYGSPCPEAAYKVVPEKSATQCPKAAAQQRVCLCEMHDQEAYKMVLEKPA